MATLTDAASALQSTPFRPTYSTTQELSDSTQSLCNLVHYATLAPSSHNTQCWRFLVDPDQLIISVIPDFQRSCPVVDPDDHHLYVSLGCAVENLVVAAKAHGYDVPKIDSSNPKNGIHVQLQPGKTPVVTEFFQAIPHRQVTRCEYDGKPLCQKELDQLQEAGRGTGVRVILITDREKMDEVLEFIVAANTAQMSNAEFKHELLSWIRFNEKDAVGRGDGLFGKCTGNPAVPSFLGKAIFHLLVRPSSENQKIVQQVKSSAGFAVFVSEKDDPVHWVEAGRCYERFALKATAMGVRNAMLNQPIEESDVRPRFAKCLGLTETERPDLLVRFGKSPPMPISPRRHVEDVLEIKRCHK